MGLWPLLMHRAQSEASALSAVSALPVASVAVGASAAAGALLAVPVVLSTAGTVLVVKAVEVTARRERFTCWSAPRTVRGPAWKWCRQGSSGCFHRGWRSGDGGRDRGGRGVVGRRRGDCLHSQRHGPRAAAQRTGDKLNAALINLPCDLLKNWRLLLGAGRCWRCHVSAAHGRSYL